MTKEQYYEQGMSEFAMGEFEKAIEAYQQAIEVDAKFFDAWHALGMAYLRAGKIQEAIAAGKRAVEIDPNDMLAHTSLSMYYMRAGDKALAEKEKGLATVLSWGGKVDKLDEPEKKS
jgi:tetratricopeptide (TPR) repeat protein